ncbi:MAG: hypothetical protein KGL39_03975 [Patescibacteria group bacterium]|nr:hypothetical protein [Patescibacteria group bacterium]
MGAHAIRDHRKGRQGPATDIHAPMPTQSIGDQPPTSSEIIQSLRHALSDIYDLTERGLPRDEMLKAIRQRAQLAIRSSVIV